MVSSRALFGTALGLALAGCAVSGGPAEYTQIQPLGGTIPIPSRQPLSPQAASHVVPARPVEQGVQVASLQPVVGEVPLVQTGTVLWHREEAAPPQATAQGAPAVPDISRQLQTLSQQQTKTQAQLSALQAQQQALQTQAVNAVTSVAQLSQQALAANAQTESNLKNFAELKAVQESRRAAADAKVFTAEQLAQANANTAQVLAQTYQQAGQRAEQIADAKTGAIAAQFANLAQNTVNPEQARAIALQSVQDSKDYIKTVARNTVQDESDPAMTQALSNAASNVITKNDKVVFAIRRAVAEELQGVAQGKSPSSTAVTRLGPDHTDGKDIQLDPNRLKIAQLMAPGGGPATDANLAGISPAAGSAPAVTAMLNPNPAFNLNRARSRSSWMDIRQYKVVVHQDNQTIGQMLNEVVAAAEPFAGPWQIKWRLSEDNKTIMNEKFSLDAETNFDEFLSYLSQYVMNDRGVKLSFSLFDTERVIVISD
jgi:hypothetical protein